LEKETVFLKSNVTLGGGVWRILQAKPQFFNDSLTLFDVKLSLYSTFKYGMERALKAPKRSPGS
jgi:hypothetical protein